MNEERNKAPSGPDGIEQAAVRTARAAAEDAHPRRARRKPDAIVHLLERDLEHIRAWYKKLVYDEERVTKAFEWLYDNYYILEREGRMLVRELRQIEPLPCGRDGLPAVYLHAQSLCRAARGRLDAAAIEAYLSGAQQVRNFESLELAAFLPMLRAALIDQAAEACSEKTPEETRELLLSDAVKTLHFLTTYDFSEIVERLSCIEKILSDDPAGCYAKMDERSRALYRRRVALIARRGKLPEEDVARRAVELARKAVTARERHVGYYLLETRLGERPSGARGRLYLCLLWLVPALLALLCGVLLHAPLLPVLLYLPLWEIARPVVDYLILKGVPATFLPRLEQEGVVPDGAPTLVIVSVLLSKPDKIEGFAKRLEQFYYSNGRGNIRFALLADLKQSRLPEQPEDRAVVGAAVKAVRQLNEKLGPHFLLLIRSRRMIRTQGEFGGWERKRGAIVELVRLIKGRTTSISTVEGDLSWLRGVRYLITLDADTGLLMDAASEMVSVAMHPLNRPEVDEAARCVTHGYGILAPRIGVDLQSAGRTPFSRIMAGCGGVTAYDNAAADTYQDLFGEGVYSGKGLIDVDAFYRVLDGFFPENRVLSHDILEGCFMRAGFLSDVELTDGFPARPVPWFSRLHRWIRGDWQNLCYIGGKIPTADGSIPTPLNAVSRFKLTDNLRRSLTPVISFLCLVAAAFSPLAAALTLIAAAFLSLAGAGLWNACLAVTHGGFSMLSRKYHCRVLPQALNSIAQGILLYLFLPYQALIAADGIARALWRQVTGRKMLEWVTAAESESRHTGAAANIRRFWLCTVVGACFLFAAPSPAAKIAGAFWIITPLIAVLSQETAAPRSEELGDAEKERLRSYAAAMWRYYEDYAGAADHYLPCDNMQEAPIHAVAHRTSPTNIGLMLLSTLAARDLGLIDGESLFDRVEKTLATVESLPKWKGHLYNWYDTRTLQPLRPAYVSTVDSGNLLCCLTALRQGLGEYARSGAAVAAAERLLPRIRALEDAVDLEVLYNKRRKLFHIGYDVEKDALSDIYYDLLMSEARMTSYYAVAKRVASKKHWGVLGRTLTRQSGYAGPVSWTGTMFEYMMPHLLLPVFEDSMDAEALRFALFCQKRRVKGLGVPWGISESGFYSFDAALNYQYEAHGVQKLALKRGMDNVLVISPYSTFIALPFDPQAGMKNLARLEELGLYGRCGFYEAADFTYKRTGGGMAVVKSYMAHHVGMSMVSCANALFAGIMQNRFMRDNQMRAAQDLLEEQIPANAVVFRDVPAREVPVKPGRWQMEKEEFETVSPVTPRVHAVSNGEYTMVVSDTGASVSMFRGIDITRRTVDLLRAPLGVYAVAQVDGAAFSLTAAPAYDGRRLVRRKVEFTANEAVFHARTGFAEAEMRACLHGRMPCEARHVEIDNYGQKKAEVKLLLYFEPVLAKTADEAAHPAFSRLFLSASYRPDTRMLIFARRPRGGELPAFLAVGFAEMELDFDFETARGRLLLRPLGIASLEGAADAPFTQSTGALPEAAAALRIRTELSPRGRLSATLLLAAANSADEAAERLIEARRLGYQGILRNSSGKDGSEMESRLAALMLPQILFPVADGIERAEAVHRNRLGQAGLWSLGVSGDFPIVLFEYAGAADRERLELYIRTQKAMRLKGIQVDLVIVYRESGDYARQKHDAIREAIKDCGCEYLAGGRGGVHAVNLSLHPGELRDLLLASSCHVAENGVIRQRPSKPYALAQLRPGRPPAEDGEPEADGAPAVYAGRFLEDGFRIPHDGDSGDPPAPWCQILANEAFGTLLSDRSLGCSWAVNARENKLTPWNNDPLAENRGEMLLIRLGGRIYDACAGARVTYRDGEALYESEFLETACRVQVTVPPKLTAKVVEVEMENRTDGPLELQSAYYIEPVLGVGPLTRRFLALERRGNAALLRNPWAPVRGVGFLAAPGGMDALIYDRAAFLSGRWENLETEVSPDPCAAALVRWKLPPHDRRKITYVLGWAAGEEAALKIAEELAPRAAAAAAPRRESFIRVKTPDPRLDRLVNGWLRCQFMSSRIYGRTGFYQCGGAWGFRDQLQDCCAALLLDPEIARAHIYRCAAHQFKEGDVMHWWHQLPPRDGGTRGVRTRCSDDLLWLPYTVCEYLEKTGDESILRPEIRYLDGPELGETEDDRYFFPPVSGLRENVYRHCVRAVERARRYGPHGLPLFGNGDWNDGMNKVGEAGKGESVWLALFLALVLDRFAPVCEKMNEPERAEEYRAEAKRLRAAVDENCWDGEWYLRGFYDDGAVLGGSRCGECRIDSLPQSFSAIAGMPDRSRVNTALDSALRLLRDGRLHIVRLFDPAFDSGDHNPGYIRAYPPGIRENGGQYTHAAVWLALGLLCGGRPDDAYQILTDLNPAFHAQDKKAAETYRLEPYVIAADVYSNHAVEGRGGWSFYTGAAGWYYRTAVEHLLGIRIRPGAVELAPCLPSAWPGYEAELSVRGTAIRLRVERGGGKGLTVDGKKAAHIPLDGTPHEAELRLPGSEPAEKPV